jgi:uracil-DNA glycosylase
MSTEKISPKLQPSWLTLLKDEFDKPYFNELKHFLVEERKHHLVFPPGSKIFSALDATPVEEVRVVIIGQDPYHGLGQANGMCFSVEDGFRFPPSLKNIFKELVNDMDVPYPTSGDLSPWAKQGVLLLNATLTVREKQAGSHQNKGWEVFTDKLISNLSEQSEGLIFLLWGNFAKRKVAHIDKQKHHFLTAAHPSPFSAHNGFFGCKHFSKTNALLKQMNRTTIDWRLN